MTIDAPRAVRSNMKRSRIVVAVPALAALAFRGLAVSAPAEPGPEAAGLRLRLTVASHPQDGKEGYNVQADIINVSREALLLRADHWRLERKAGGFKE